jgi:exopolysaccharide biosynthesis predicted pyruvyltransferase EpsI
VALVNFPNHGNPGDPGLWLGTHALLRAIGVRVVYQADPSSLDLGALDRAVGANPVLINGGGNFGDLYVGQQQARVRLLESWTGRPVIQLPQSVHFEDPKNAEAMARLIARHGAFTMMVRDQRSADLSAQLLHVTPLLSPDHAFGLYPLASEAELEHDILWMVWPEGAREYTAESQPIEPPASVHVEDWYAEAGRAHESFDVRGRFAWRTNRVFHKNLASPAVKLAWPILAATYKPLARRWFMRGVDMVAGSRVLVTNKLHGHIVATLLGMPHVVLDNSYGKVAGTLNTWTRSLPGVHVARDASEALDMALSLLPARRG